MVSWHEVTDRNGRPTGRLVKCKTDPCPLPGHSNDIRASSESEAYRLMEEASRSPKPSGLLSRQSRLDMKVTVPIGRLHRMMSARGVKVPGGRIPVKDIRVFFPSVRVGFETGFGRRKVNSLCVIGEVHGNGYDGVAVKLPKWAARILRISTDGKVGLVVTHVDEGVNPNLVKWDGYYDPVPTPFTVSRPVPAKPVGADTAGITERERAVRAMMTLRYGGKPITRKHFNGVVDGVSGVITTDDWKHLKKISGRLTQIAYGNGIDRGARSLDRVEEKIQGYLESDEEDARAFREYCGDDVSMEDVSSILARNVRAMTDAIPYNGKAERRSVLSSTSNDMNRRRYISSVLFFGGRCCYCGIPLKKSRTGVQKHDSATGDHLDPMDGMPPGETKFGNMAICCSRCNKDKANKPLNEWLDSTDKLSDAQRKVARETIESFRDFAMYEPMSMVQGEWINEKIREAHKLKAGGASNEEIRRFIHGVIGEFQEGKRVELV